MVNRRRFHFRNEVAVVIPFLVIIMFALIALFVLALGITFVATEKTRLQLTTNLVNLAALEEYIFTPPSSNSESVRRQRGRDKASALAGLNRLATTPNALGANISSPGIPPGGGGAVDGRLRYGNYYHTADPASSCTEFPCFEEVNMGAAGNATYLKLDAAGSNAVSGLLTGILGRDTFDISSNSVATLVEICIAHAMDVSDSTFASTHKKSYFECENTTLGVPFQECPATNQAGGEPPEPHPYLGRSVSPPLTPPAFVAPPRWIVTNPVETDPAIIGAVDDLIAQYSPGTTFSSSDWPLPTASKFAMRVLNLFNLGGGGPTCPAPQVLFQEGSVRRCLIPRPCECPGLDYCSSDDYYYGVVPNQKKNEDFFHWCNLLPSRANFEARTGLNSDNFPKLRFRSDYEMQWVAFGLLEIIPQYIYKYTDSEPWRSFMLAANVALRTLNSLPSSGNKGMMMAFTGDSFGRAFPGPSTLTDNLELLTQLTNASYLGGVDKDGVPLGNALHPNPTDYGFISFIPRHPLAADYDFWTNTNILKALSDNAFALGNDCSDQARKMINIYTDGLATCSYSNSAPGAFGENLPGLNFNEFECSNSGLFSQPWQRYRRFEYGMMTGMIPWLQDQKISVNVFLDGSGLRLNYRNIRNDTAAPNSSCVNWDTPSAAPPGEESQVASCFHDFTSAAIAGYGGPRETTVPGFILGNCDPGTSMAPGSFFDCESKDPAGNTVSDSVAFDQVTRGNIDYQFGRAAAVMGGLAMKTGGELCLLFDVQPSDVGNYADHDGDFRPSQECPDSTESACCMRFFNSDPLTQGHTACRLRNTVRNADGALSLRSLDFLPRPAQAARCAAKAVQASPFILKAVKEVNCITPGC